MRKAGCKATQLQRTTFGSTPLFRIRDQSGPAYKAQKIQGGPGKMRILHFHWSPEREVVTRERSGSWDADSLWYSSSPGGHWPLSWVGSLTGMLNFHWPSAHPGSWGRLGEMLHFDWLCGQPFFFSFSGTFYASAGWMELLEIPSKWRVQGY